MSRGAVYFLRSGRDTEQMAVAYVMHPRGELGGLRYAAINVDTIMHTLRLAVHGASEATC